MMRMGKLSVLVAVCLLAGSCWAQQADPELQVEFDEKGPARIVHRGTVLLGPEGTRPPEFSKGWRGGTHRFDLATRTSTTEAAWGKMQVEYKVEGNQLICTAQFTPTEKVEDMGEFWPIRLRLPRHRDSVYKNFGPQGTLLRHQTGTVGIITSPEGVNGVLRSPYPTPAGAVPLQLGASAGRQARHPIVDNQWFFLPSAEPQPYETVEWRLTLAFGPPESTLTSLFPTLYKEYARAKPVEFKWPDRRPIGTIFFAHPVRGWKTNPRGFNFGRAEKHDVFTEEGLKIFGEELMAYADTSIEIMKSMNAQGTIVWNLEGEERHHPISYLADPQQLAAAAPEMDRFADAFFQKFSDAGLKTGITIRPTEVFDRQPGKRDWYHRDVADPVKLMSDKIAYAQKRWGCTIFYIDSNVFGTGFDTKLPPNSLVPWVSPVSMMQRLYELHPDVLLIPEWGDGELHRFSAPYSSPNLGVLGTDEATRQRYPTGFRVVAVNVPLLERNWDTYVRQVRDGDVLLFPAWYPALENEMVRYIYREANYLRQPIPEPLKNAAATALAEHAKAADERTRYHAARLLARHTEPEALAAVAALLEDQSLIVRKTALQAVAAQKRVPSDAVLHSLIAGLERKGPHDIVLRGFFADALAGLNDAAVPRLLELLDTPKTDDIRPLLVRTVGRSGTQDPKVHEALLALLTDPARAALREPTANALGELRIKSAVPALLALLEPEAKDENLRLAAIQALGKIGDKGVLPVLIAEWKRPYVTRAFAWKTGILDDSLSALTGERGLTGDKDWPNWWAKNTPKENT